MITTHQVLFFFFFFNNLVPQTCTFGWCKISNNINEYFGFYSKDLNLRGGGKYKTYDCRVEIIFSQVQLNQYHDILNLYSQNHK